MLMAVTPAALNASTSSCSLKGSRKEMWMAPFLSWLISSSGGLRSRSSKSALPSNAARSVTTLAPASSNSLSLMPIAVPTPASTCTSAPWSVKRWTEAGMMGIRVSPGASSLGIPMIIRCPLLSLWARGPI